MNLITHDILMFSLFQKPLNFKLSYNGEVRLCMLSKPVHVAHLIAKVKEFFGSTKDIYHIQKDKVPSEVP